MIKLCVNGKTVSMDAEPGMPLLGALRENLQLTGTKFGCGSWACRRRRHMTRSSGRGRR